MRLFELFDNTLENFLLELKKQPVDVEHYGNWTVELSKQPVIMGTLTNNEKKFVAKLTHKKLDKTFIGIGNTQGEARDKAFEKAQAERPEDPDAFKSFTADLNADFTREYFDPRTGGYFKFKTVSGKVFLVMAGIQYFREFGREIEQLGFKKSSNRVAKTMTGNATEIYGFPVTKNEVKALGLVPNMRYTLDQVEDDEDGNAMFLMHPDTRVQSRGDKYRMGRPGVTIAGTLAEEEQLDEKKKKPKPTSPEKWAQAKAKARSKFEVYPSAYANAWAAKEYKRMGGGWRMGE